MVVSKRARQLAIICALFLLDIVLGSRAAAQTRGRSEVKSITLGIAADFNPKEVEERFQDFVRYVASKLSSASKIEGRIVVAPTQSRLASLLTERKADFYMESPYPTYLINSVYGAGKLLLRRWKGGMADYHALIFTKKDGATKRLEDLRGKFIAFEDPDSTSGYFLPNRFLAGKGFKLLRKTEIEAKVSPREVGYIFANSQDKLIDLVITEQVAAGAFSNDDYAALEDRKKSAITILAETSSLPRHLVSIRRDLAQSLANRLAKILTSMHQDPEGLLVLQRTDGTTKFDALPGGELAMRQRLLDTYSTAGKK